MKDDLRAQIHRSLDQKETSELIEIWQEHDSDEWAESTFDVIEEILQERQVEPPLQEKPRHKRLSTDVTEITDVGELEKKTKELELSLRRAKNTEGTWWVTLVGSLFATICVGFEALQRGDLLIGPILLLIYVGFNIWRLYRAHAKGLEIESKLREYHLRMEDIQLSPPIINP